MKMKKLLLKIALFFALFIICDMILGKVLGQMVESIRIGGQGRDNYICNKSTEDILVFGSSRCVHHYNAKMLEDSTGLSCYNCGDDGNGIFLAYTRLHLALERHRPKVVIYDVVPIFDLTANENDNHTYLGWLRNRYDREGIAELFHDIDSLEQYKMLCSSYRYNSKIVQNLFVYLTHISSDHGVKGYRPLHSKFNPMKIKDRQYLDTIVYDPVKLKYMDKFIQECKGSKLYFVISPQWYKIDLTKPRSIVWLRERCEKEGIPFYDFTNDPKYVHNNAYFKDGTHLNSKGADEFTRDLLKLIDLKQENIKDNSQRNE